MVRLRMQRAGKTHQPFYKIIAAHKTRKRDGEFIERVGSYNPTSNPPLLEVNEAKVMKWLKDGAQPTDTVKSFLRKLGILHKFRLAKRGLSAEQVQAEMEKWSAIQAKKGADKKVKKTKALKKKEKPADATPAA